MERLMEKHNKEEIAFQKVKQATSIKNANEFIDKFLGREETYGLLLESISEKENRLEEIKQERDQLEKNYSDTVYKSEEIMEVLKSVENKQVTNIEKELQEVKEKLLLIQRQTQAMYHWSVKFLASYHDKRRNEIQKKFPKGSEKQLMLEVLSVMKAFINELSSKQVYNN